MNVEMSKSDVTLVIDGREFYCLKETLSQHSTYFQSMFFSNFAEKDKSKIELKGVSAEDFQLFLHAIVGVNSITDENIESGFALSSFLGSSELGKVCITHLAQGSRISLKEQFQLAEMHHSEELMIQVCSSIEDAYELDDVVPKDLNSFCNTTKNIVLQRSFELLGIRKPPLPPQSEEPVTIFGDIMHELLDQADVQNRHGMILADQATLVKNHIISEEILDRELPQVRPMIQQDPRVHELMEELRNSHSPAERNAVRAQIQVVKFKNIYTALSEIGETPEHLLRERMSFCLGELYRIILRNQRNHSESNPINRGELLVDQMYREIMQLVDARPTEALNDGFEPIWVTKINEGYTELLPWREEVTQNASDHISETFRGVSENPSFMDSLVSYRSPEKAFSWVGCVEEKTTGTRTKQNRKCKNKG
ncbi:unnamed protein product [Caenorhabditis brenneri]